MQGLVRLHALPGQRDRENREQLRLLFHPLPVPVSLVPSLLNAGPLLSPVCHRGIIPASI